MILLIHHQRQHHSPFWQHICNTQSEDQYRVGGGASEDVKIDQPQTPPHTPERHNTAHRSNASPSFGQYLGGCSTYYFAILILTLTTFCLKLFCFFVNEAELSGLFDLIFEYTHYVK